MIAVARLAPEDVHKKFLRGCHTRPEINDRLAANAELSKIQVARQMFGNGYVNNCCPTCKKTQLAGECNCRLTVAQAAALKSNIRWPHTADRNA